jgi:hypothetical protein
VVQFLLCDKLVERKTHHLKHEKAAQVPQPDLKLGARFRLTQLGAERCPKFAAIPAQLLDLPAIAVGFAFYSTGQKDRGVCTEVISDRSTTMIAPNQLRTRFSAKDPLLNKRLDGTTIGTSSSSCIDRRSSLVSSFSGKVARAMVCFIACFFGGPSASAAPQR